MTEKMAVAARKIARPATEIITATPKTGPASIQGFLDGALCQAAMIEESQRHGNIDAILVGCFDDTGLDALRTLHDVPVVGIGEAGYITASMLAPKFSVVTTLKRSIAVLEGNILRYGLAGRCARVRASDVPVLDLEKNDPAALDLIRGQIKAALEEDGAEAIVLGCAGMTDLVERMRDEFGVPVVDGVVSGLTILEGMVATGLTTSKVNTYNIHDKNH